MTGNQENMAFAEAVLECGWLRVGFHWRPEPSFAIERVVLAFSDCAVSRKLYGSVHPFLESAAADVALFLEGKLKTLSLDCLDISFLSPFAKRVLRELRENVSFGERISYGELARLADAPNAARAVGTVLRRNPFPLFSPCHRVIRSDGAIGGFQGAGDGWKLKQALLDWELCDAVKPRLMKKSG